MEVEANAEKPFSMTNFQMHKKKKKRKTDVLSKVHQMGPLSLLHRAVAGNIKVKVWVRSSHYIRSICNGFLVAFDKHFNLALQDVDESYINPVAIRKIYKCHKKKERRNKKNKDDASNTKSDIIYLPCDISSRGMSFCEDDNSEVPNSSINKNSITGEVSDNNNSNDTPLYMERYIPKLFLRGDSVVMVSLCSSGV